MGSCAPSAVMQVNAVPMIFPPPAQPFGPWLCLLESSEDRFGSRIMSTCAISVSVLFFQLAEEFNPQLPNSEMATLHPSHDKHATERCPHGRFFANRAEGRTLDPQRGNTEQMCPQMWVSRAPNRTHTRGARPGGCVCPPGCGRCTTPACTTRGWAAPPPHSYAAGLCEGEPEALGFQAENSAVGP